MAEKPVSINTNMNIVTNPLFLQLLVGILIGLGAGYLGSFMIIKRMSLVGDVISHVALPGIAIALIFQINPFLSKSTTSPLDYQILSTAIKASCGMSTFPNLLMRFLPLFCLDKKQYNDTIVL